MVFTGNGKGKTTAAIGQAVRAVGAGKRVFMIQFIKSEGFASGEDGVLRSLSPHLHFEKGGLGFVGILGDTLPLASHKRAAKQVLAKAKAAALSGDYDLVILDEINTALDLHLLTLDEVTGFLESVPKELDLVFTGRYAHSEILYRADLITQYEEVVHPFQSRVPARRGIEY